MGKKTIKCNNIRLSKKQFYKSKKSIDLFSIIIINNNSN